MATTDFAAKRQEYTNKFATAAKPYVVSAQDKFRYYMAQVDKELSKYPTLNRLEQQLQVPKAYAVLGVVGVFSTFIFFNIFAAFLSNLLGWAVPAYLSIKALETPSPEDDIQWLTYWVIFGFFNFFESFSNFFVNWFRYYYVFKTVFILYLILPSTRGALVLYTKVIKPFTFNSSKSTGTSSVPTTGYATGYDNAAPAAN